MRPRLLIHICGTFACTVHANRLAGNHDGALEPPTGMLSSAVTVPPTVLTFEQGTDAVLACPVQAAPSTLSVLHATFPGFLPEALESVTLQVISQLCNGRPTCTFPVTAATFPFIPGAGALELSYVCSRRAAPHPAVGMPPQQEIERLPQGGGWTLMRSISPLGAGNESALVEPKPPGTQAILLSNRDVLARTYLRLPNVVASCTRPLSLAALSIEEGEHHCLATPACSIVSAHPDGKVTLCEDHALTAPTSVDGATTSIKGSKVHPSWNQQFAIYLNTQGICEDDHVLEEVDGVDSVDAAITRCGQDPSCAYFVLSTVSSDLPSTHLWLCGLPETNAFHSVHEDGSISGYRPEHILTYGFPQVLA